MKKTIAVWMLVMALMLTMIVPAGAFTPAQERTADALNHLGLFLGDGVSYDLDGSLTRAQGVTLLIRMMGKEAEAEAHEYVTPFTDVADWAKPYVGFAYEHRITFGTGATTFGSEEAMTDFMFLTLVLRALGYADSGADPQFAWDQPHALAKEVGLIAAAEADAAFTRGDAVAVFWNALQAKLAGSEQTLAQSLMELGVFTAEAFAEAAEIQKNGRTENPGSPAEKEEDVTPPTPEEPETPDVPDTPDTPEEPETPEAPDPGADGMGWG